MIWIWNKITPSGLRENSGQYQLLDHSRLPPPALLIDVSSPTLENEVSYSEVTLHATYCWKQQLSIKAAGASILCCAA